MVIRSLRRSFAAKLIVAGCTLALVVVGGVATYLILSRAAQTTGAAQSNADNRVNVMAQVLDRFTGAEALGAAQSLAAQGPLQDALSSPGPAATVTALLGSGGSLQLSGDVLLVTDSSGAIVYTQAAADLGAPPLIGTAPEAALAALSGAVCARHSAHPVAGGCGIEVISDAEPAYVVAVPVLAGGRAVGAVAYVAPLNFQLLRFQQLFSFPTAFIAAQNTAVEVRTLGGDAGTAPALRSVLTGTRVGYHAVYDAPVGGGATGSVAGSFVPTFGASGEVTGYIGVEVPLAQFSGDERTDILAVALIAVFLLLVVAIMVVVFVEAFVKRPIARLEQGVGRIAGGDYATAIAVRSGDELGRLAGNVNRMRDSIAEYVREIEEARARVDSALERVSGVSRALTTTTGGVAALQEAVVRTAAAIGGGAATSVLALRAGDRLVSAAVAGEPPPLEALSGVDGVLTGETVHLDHPGHGTVVAVPMYYQDRVVGALAVISPADQAGQSGAVDVDVLAVLANNAAIAMENARLFEQERETVRRLLELDAMKTDFLSTVQHELRTPLTAIVGLADLLDMCWAAWEEGPKLEAVHDIQVAAKNLHDIVETIIDYSAMGDEQVGLNPALVPLGPAITTALELVGERYKGGLPVPVDVDSNEDISVYADPERLGQVLRAVLDNAVKFSDGRGRVRVSFGPANRGRRVRIEVVDQGVGIAADELPRVFDRFYQVDNTATRKYGGTGMGLALVKRMVQAHGATVELESVAGEGTTVVLVWPTSPASAAGEARAVAEERGEMPRRRMSRRSA